MECMDKNYNTEEIFSRLVEEAKNANKIPAEKFESYKVKRGLREMDGTGVLAGVTNVGNAHGYVVYESEKIADEGKLEYRGLNMTSLIEGFTSENRFGFEECIYLLLFGKLPTKSQLDDFCALLDEKRRLPAGFTENIIMKAPSPSIMNKMAMSVLALYSYDDNPDDTSLENMLRQSIEIIARLPVIAANSYRVYRTYFHGKSLNIHTPKSGLTSAENFLRISRSTKTFTEEEARLLDLCMVIQAEHGGGNNSTFACRVLSSSGTDTYSAIAAGIGSLKGPLHGGANIKVQQMFDCIRPMVKDVNDDEEIKSILSGILHREIGDGLGKIYGMGHAVYTKSDPRAIMLKKYARELVESKGCIEDFNLMESIERQGLRALSSRLGGRKRICANVDMYSGLIYQMLGIPEDLFTPLFAIARIAGWCAHRIEEVYTGGRIIRPAYRAVMNREPYVPMDERE